MTSRKEGFFVCSVWDEGLRSKITVVAILGLIWFKYKPPQLILSFSPRAALVKEQSSLVSVSQSFQIIWFFSSFASVLSYRMIFRQFVVLSFEAKYSDSFLAQLLSFSLNFQLIEDSKITGVLDCAIVGLHLLSALIEIVIFYSLKNDFCFWMPASWCWNSWSFVQRGSNASGNSLVVSTSNETFGTETVVFNTRIVSERYCSW